jgi:hypothetical protein
MQAKFLFGDIVIVEGIYVGVILKTWEQMHRGTANPEREHFNYEVYVRSWNSIKEYGESQIDRYRVRHKELEGDELEWQQS